jgi:hypothetical protein
MNELINHYDYIIIIKAAYTWTVTNTSWLSFGLADRMVASGQLSGCNG